MAIFREDTCGFLGRMTELRGSGRDGASADDDSRLRADARKQAAHISFTQGDTALGRPEAASGQVQENGAAALPPDRPAIPADLDNDVIEMIVAPHYLVRNLQRGLLGQEDRLVVEARCRIITPGIRAANAARGKSAARTGEAICTPPEGKQGEISARCGTIALALVGANAGAADGAGQAKPTGE
jgi:hypothetical protein